MAVTIEAAIVVRLSMGLFICLCFFMICLNNIHQN